MCGIALDMTGCILDFSLCIHSLCLQLFSKPALMSAEDQRVEQTKKDPGKKHWNKKGRKEKGKRDSCSSLLWPPHPETHNPKTNCNFSRQDKYLSKGRRA